MYTSCGWFFDEVSRVEPVQIMRYAARVTELAERRGAVGLRERLLSGLEAAPSNDPRYGSARGVWERRVAPAAHDAARAGQHHALRALLGLDHEHGRRRGFQVQPLRHDARAVGSARVVDGCARLVSCATTEVTDIVYAAIDLGGLDVQVAARPASDAQAHRAAVDAVAQALGRGDVAGARELLDAYGVRAGSFASLPDEAQRQVIARRLEEALAEAEAAQRELHRAHAPLLDVLRRRREPLPPLFEASEALLLHREVSRALAEPAPDAARLRRLLRQAVASAIRLERRRLGPAVVRALSRLARAWADTPQDARRLGALAALVAVVRELPFPVDLWGVQNIVWEAARGKAGRGGAAATASTDAVWREAWIRVADGLGMVP
jgi:hypothetical protein